MKGENREHKTGTHVGQCVLIRRWCLERKPGLQVCEYMGHTPRYFKKKYVYAIHTCTFESLRRQPRGQTICIRCDR